MTWACDSCGDGLAAADLYTFGDGLGYGRGSSLEALCLPCVVSGMAHGHKHVHDEPADCRTVVHTLGCVRQPGGACAEWLACRPQVVECADPVQPGCEPCGLCDECGAGIQCREVTA